jgi:hypothetical protein
MKSITRRSAIWTMTALSTSLAYAREKGTAFALIGDRPHNSDYIRTALNRDIVKGLGVSVDMTDDYTSLTAETLDGYKMLIVHRMATSTPRVLALLGEGAEGPDEVEGPGRQRSRSSVSRPFSPPQENQSFG